MNVMLKGNKSIVKTRGQIRFCLPDFHSRTLRAIDAPAQGHLRITVHLNRHSKTRTIAQARSARAVLIGCSDRTMARYARDVCWRDHERENGAQNNDFDPESSHLHRISPPRNSVQTERKSQAAAQPKTTPRMISLWITTLLGLEECGSVNKASILYYTVHCTS